MVFYFSKKYAFPPNLHIGDSEMLRKVTKFLGVKIQNNLKWQENTDFICQKAIKRLWLIRRLKIFGLEIDVLTDYYKKEVRPHLELAVPVWDSGLTRKQSKQIEAVQRQAALIILEVKLSYQVSCTLLGIESLYLRRAQMALNWARRTAAAPQHNFFEKVSHKYEKRTSSNHFREFKCNYNRFYTSPLCLLTRTLNNHMKHQTSKNNKYK